MNIPRKFFGGFFFTKYKDSFMKLGSNIDRRGQFGHLEVTPAEFGSNFSTNEIKPSALDIQHPQIVLLNDFVRNVGILINHIEAEQDYDIPLEQATIDQILNSDIEDALTESLGTKTYGDTVGNEIKTEVLVYESFVRTMIREILKNDSKEFQKKELQKIINETNSFKTVEDIPLREELRKRIQDIQEAKLTQEQINNMPESNNSDAIAA